MIFFKQYMKHVKNFSSSKQSPIRQSKASKGKLVLKEGNIISDTIDGIALSVIGNTVLVEIKSESDTSYVECSVSGRVVSPHKDSTLIAVGDFVKILLDKKSDESDKRGRIVAVDERINKLSRRAVGKSVSEHVIAANFDNLFILGSTFQPNYNKRFIDRLIIAAEIGGITPIIGINKSDLVDDLEVFREDLYVYAKIDVPVLFFSALNNTGIDDIINITQNKKTLFFGASGVGKSTLVNLLLGDSVQNIREISDRTNKGQHTTSFVRMLDLPYGGQIIDSPGVREFAMWDIDKLNLAMHFHDFDDYYLNCRYLPCTHTHEPDCAIIKALEEGELDPDRYESYLNIYDTLDD